MIKNKEAQNSLHFDHIAIMLACLAEASKLSASLLINF